MAQSLRKEVFNGLIWSFVERFSGQILGFVAVVIMSRLLSQAEYGLVGMIMIFIDIAQGLVDSGISQALIRKQDRSQIDSSTTFYFNLVMSGCLYLILFFTAPMIARFYNQPILVPLVRVVSISVLINALIVVQRALLTIRIDFKTQAKASVIGAAVSGGIGIYMAYNGYGVWSIAVYQLSNLFISGILIWCFARWFPSFCFSWSSFRSMFRFGVNLTVAGLMHTIYNDLYLVFIGKIYNAAALGSYTRAHQFAALPSSNLNGILQRVSYPVLCRFQDDSDKLRETLRKFMRLTVFVVFPLMTGLSMLAQPLVVVLMGERWLLSGVLLQIICLALMWIPVDSLNVNLLQVVGRTDLFLRIEIIKKAVGIGVIAATVPFGLQVICWGQVVNQFIVIIIDTYYTGKFINYGFKRQLTEFLPTICYCLIMAVMMWLATNWIFSNLLKLIVGICVGIICYWIIAKITGSADLREIKTIIANKETIQE